MKVTKLGGSAHENITAASTADADTSNKNHRKQVSWVQFDKNSSYEPKLSYVGELDKDFV